MDPASIVGLILSVGQCIQPFIACLRTIAEYRQIDKTISEALKKALLYCERLELSLGDLKLIDESSITSGHKDFLRRTLNEFHAAVMSHRAEVDSWILRLGLSDKLEVDGVYYTPQAIRPSTPTTDKTVMEDDINIRHCIGTDVYILATRTPTDNRG